ncbi:MAG: zinc ribbon domain-containing protein [Gemmatimonadetes bacterium]|nr:zinc ribbon domain-containing protein [Gemmatimonadota bacterium]NNM06286.1 zinc ribbon domain-containing protein [Gemmatimonadota bacterium]
MKCPACGAVASGKFCSACGNSLKSENCKSCGASVPPGSRFCTGCGKAMSGRGGRAGPGPVKGGTQEARSPSGGNPTVAWWVAGTLLVVVLFALGYPVLTRGTGPQGGGAAPAGMGGSSSEGAAVDLTTMSLEEQATILFNRVMTSSSAGDTADVDFFLPKALVIYEQVNPTDPDGLFHFALLHEVGGDAEAALAKAQEGLAQVPDYLLLLAVAGRASATLGDEEGAEGFYGHFLDVYDTEMGLLRPGYEHHQPIFPAYREEAEAFLGRG